MPGEALNPAVPDPLFLGCFAPGFGAVLGCFPYLDTIGCTFDRV